MASKQERRGTQEIQGIQGKQGKPVRRRTRAMGAMRNAYRNSVECPDPLDGSVDEGARTANRCEADREDGDGCRSMPVGEAVRLQFMGDVRDMADPGRTPCRDDEHGGYGEPDGFDGNGGDGGDIPF